MTKGNREEAARGRPDTLGGASGQAHGDEQDGGAASRTTGNGDARQLLASLRELVDRDGPVKTSEALGVTYRTVTRAIDTGTLTGRMEDALKRRELEAGGGAGRAPSRRLEALERRQERLEAGLAALAQELGAQLASISGELAALRNAASDGKRRDGAGGDGAEPAPAPALRGVAEPLIGRKPATKPWRAHPELVTLEPEEGEELVYGDATPLIVEWRRARAGFLDKRNSRVERATAWVRMCELAITLIGDFELTLPLADYPWDAFERRREARSAERSLRNARRERRRALCWRVLRRVLTLGLWRR